MITRIATRYGNWVSNTRFPQFPWTRRLAKSNPADFGKFVFGLAAFSALNIAIRTYTANKVANMRLREEFSPEEDKQINDIVDLLSPSGRVRHAQAKSN